MLYTCIIPHLIKKIGQVALTQKQKPGMTFTGGDLDVKVMHTQGHRMSCCALPLYHIKFGENRLNGMGTVAKKLI